MAAGGVRRPHPSSPSCLNRAVQRTDFFHGLISLSGDLRVTHTELRALERGVFDGLHVGGIFWLIQNPALTTLAAGVFDGSRVELSLSLSWNRSLTTLVAGVFDGLTAFQVGIFNNDALTKLEPGVFDGLTATSLNLSWNTALAKLEPGVFDGLHVRDLKLHDNSALTTLQAGVFSGSSMRFLEIIKNAALTTLEPRVFDGLQVQQLLLTNNDALARLDAGVFDGFSVRDLWLIDNATLSTLEARLFDGLNVDYMTVRNDALTTLAAGVFDGLRVGVLWLSGGSLTTLEAGAFRGLRVSRSLYLHDNPGAPFPLVVEPVRTDHADPTAGPATVELRLVQGAPVEITVPVRMEPDGGAPVDRTQRIEGGAVASASFEVTGPSGVTVTVGTPIAGGLSGVELIAGDRLVVFAGGGGDGEDDVPALPGIGLALLAATLLAVGVRGSRRAIRQGAPRGSGGPSQLFRI